MVGWAAVTIGDGANDVLVSKVVYTGSVTGCCGIDAVCEVVDTASSDDVPGDSAYGTCVGCWAPDNSCKATCHTAVTYALAVGSVSSLSSPGSLLTSSLTYAASAETAADLARLAVPELMLVECDST